MNGPSSKRATNRHAHPGKELATAKMPGHWLLARLGKRVLRPGGLELTRRMLESLGVLSSDEVVEFAPGLGTTARMTLAKSPASYTGVERDEAAASQVREYLDGPGQQCRVGDAEETGLADETSTVVYGEAMLTMQRPPQKRRIVSEAHRILRSGGRYGIHELCLVPDELSEATKEEIQWELSGAIHVGARPLTPSEWRNLLETEGFVVGAESLAPMHLLEPRRMVQDEGLAGALRFVRNLLQDAEARKRVLTMRKVFRRHKGNLAAITLVGVKPGD